MNTSSLDELFRLDYFRSLNGRTKADRDYIEGRIKFAEDAIDAIDRQFVVFKDTINEKADKIRSYDKDQRNTVRRQISDVLWHTRQIRVAMTVDALHKKIDGAIKNFSPDHVLGRNFVGIQAEQMMLSGNIDEELLRILFIEGNKVILCTFEHNQNMMKFQGNALDPYLRAHNAGHDVRFFTTDLKHVSQPKLIALRDEIANGVHDQFVSLRKVINYSGLKDLRAAI